jgi:glycosyltransferase involved in cell wall biosynthesis
MIAAELAGIPWSMTCHRWDIYENNLLSVKVRSALFTRFVSERGRKDAVSLGADEGRVQVIPMGTNMPDDRVQPSWPGAETFVVLCPANLIPVKGHIYLFAALAKLVKEGHDVKLLVAGEGQLRRYLELEAQRLALGHRVSFLGHLPHDQLLAMYADRRVHATCLPSVDLGGGEHEGVPVALMEAMAYGVPSVSTKTGSIQDLIPDDFGLTVADKNSDALAAVLGALVKDRKRYEEAAQKCADRMRKDWSSDASAAQLLSLMDH